MIPRKFLSNKRSLHLNSVYEDLIVDTVLKLNPNLTASVYYGTVEFKERQPTALKNILNEAFRKEKQEERVKALAKFLSDDQGS